MHTIPRCDILVVGAGPAGSCAACAAATQGVETLLIDAKTRIGEQPHCGEFVPAQLFTEVGLDRGSIMQRVESMETRIIGPSNEAAPASGQHFDALLSGSELSGRERVEKRTMRVTTSASPGFIIDRVRFDRDLARDAAAKGATVLCATRLIRRENDSWILRHGGTDFRVNPKFVIAADGAASTVARALALRNRQYVRGIQVEVPLVAERTGTVVFLDQELVGGYGWLFPKGKTANVGLGVTARDDVHPPELLEEFVAQLLQEGLIRPGRLARSGGLIPVSGIREQIMIGNVILCGDAAGLTHPITGAGIPQAVVSGHLAGRCAATAVRMGSREPLVEYEAEVRACYRGVVNHALAKRALMMSLWDSEDFVHTCERTWIGFKGYRQRVRG